MRYPRAPLWWGGGEGGGEVLVKKGRRKVGEGERSSRVGLLLGLCLGLMACSMRPFPSFSMCFCGGATDRNMKTTPVRSTEDTISLMQTQEELKTLLKSVRRQKVLYLHTSIWLVIWILFEYKCILLHLKFWENKTLQGKMRRPQLLY